jgi:hypothetical protein
VTAAILAHLTLLIAMLVHLARIDVKHFEIDIEVVLIAAMCALTLRYALGMNLVDGVLGAVVPLTGILVLHALTRNSWGAGDNWLMGLMGLISGMQFLPVLMFFLFFGCWITSASYAHTRNRSMLKSRIPMALPGAIATALTIAVMAVAPREMRIAAYSTEALIPHQALARIATDAPLLSVVWASFGLAICALTGLSYYRRKGAVF